MKTIRRFFNNAEAEFARSLLVSVGIGAVLAEASANTLGPGYAPGGVRLQVPEEEVARAQEILGGRSEEFTPLPDDFVPPEEEPGGGEVERPAPERFTNLTGLIPAGLCVLSAMGAVYLLYFWLAPLSWTHSAAQLVHMGIIARQSQDYAKAVKYYDAALVINPRDYVAYYDRGLVFLDEKDCAKAISDFTESIKINSIDLRSYSMRGSAYYRTGNYEKALEDLNMAVSLDPTHYKAYTTMGLVYSKMGDAGKAMEDYKRAGELAPADDWFPINNQAWIYATWPEAAVRDGAKAMELAEKACELSKWNDCYCIGTLAAAEAETGKYDDAVKHQQQALEMAKVDKKVDAKMLGQMKDALAHYQQGKPYRDVNQ
jgi:tetratricopeptide (TPR) repeat protein